MDITDILIQSIQYKKPIIYCKYGDGEYNCVNSHCGSNCDNDNYTDKLKLGLLESFTYMVNERENVYIGLWVTDFVINYWESLVSRSINWVDYRSLYLCDANIQHKVILYKTIQTSPLKKIILCNELLIKSQLLFRADYMINVKLNNWFDADYQSILDELVRYIDPNDQYIIMTCAGMGSKVVIGTLSKLYPNNIYLDFGSALDKICTKRTSRGWEPSYTDLINELHDIIPENWDDPKYDSIYEAATYLLGQHLGPNP